MSANAPNPNAPGHKAPPAPLPQLNGSGLRIAVVQSRFNQHITDALWQACFAELQRLGVEDDDIAHIQVPGALEIAVAGQQIAKVARPDAMVALGCVVKGDTYHFEVVCNESSRAIAQVALDAQVPFVNMVLTTYTEAQAQERIQSKGEDAARAAVEMANLFLAFADLEAENNQDDEEWGDDDLLDAFDDTPGLRGQA